MDSRKQIQHNRANTSIGVYPNRNPLGQSQRERRKLEADAQLLANRINLLQLEEMKARKKIEETERRTNQISAARARNERRQEEKMRREKAR